MSNRLDATQCPQPGDAVRGARLVEAGLWLKCANGYYLPVVKEGRQLFGTEEESKAVVKKQEEAAQKQEAAARQQAVLTGAVVMEGQKPGEPQHAKMGVFKPMEPLLKILDCHHHFFDWSVPPSSCSRSFY